MLHVHAIIMDVIMLLTFQPRMKLELRSRAPCEECHAVDGDWHRRAGSRASPERITSAQV